MWLHDIKDGIKDDIKDGIKDDIKDGIKDDACYLHVKCHHIPTCMHDSDTAANYAHMHIEKIQH